VEGSQEKKERVKKRTKQQRETGGSLEMRGRVATTSLNGKFHLSFNISPTAIKILSCGIIRGSEGESNGSNLRGSKKYPSGRQISSHA
jgi:hypothetical protein